MFERTRGEIIGSLLSLARLKRDEAALAKHIKNDTLPAFKNDLGAMVSALATSVTGTSYQGAQPSVTENIAKIGSQIPALEIALTNIVQQREVRSLLSMAKDTRNAGEMLAWIKDKTLPSFEGDFLGAVQAIASVVTGKAPEKVEPDMWKQINAIGKDYPMLDSALTGLALDEGTGPIKIAQHDKNPYKPEKLTFEA